MYEIYHRILSIGNKEAMFINEKQWKGDICLSVCLSVCPAIRKFFIRLISMKIG
jgi:hypothetical protein